MTESPSSIILYIKCAYAYHLSKKIRLPKVDNAGSCTHKVLQHFWDFDLPREEALQKSIDKYWNPEFDTTEDVFNNFVRLVGFRKPLLLEEKLKGKKFVCIPDLVFEDKIVDFKTHNRFTKKVPLENKIQGTIISKNLKELKGLDIKNVEFWYLKKGYVQEVNVDEVEEEVDDVVNNVLHNISKEIFPKNEKACFYCNYKLICKKEKEYIKHV